MTPVAEKTTPAAKKATPAAGKVITNSIGMKLVLIPPGEFQMGSRESAEELAQAYKDISAPPPARVFRDEYPLHRVRIRLANTLDDVQDADAVIGLLPSADRFPHQQRNPVC